jgi:hypothetical protein
VDVTTVREVFNTYCVCVQCTGYTAAVLEKNCSLDGV